MHGLAKNIFSVIQDLKKNVKLLEDFIEANELTVVNGLDLCQGLFTRIRKTKNTEEKSIINFFVVCKRVLSFVKIMNIDEDRINIPTNFTQVRKGGKAVDSDHVLLEMDLDFKFIPTKPTRTILFNFKSEQGRILFRKLTTETNDFTSCFLFMQPLQIQCAKWNNLLQSYCHKSVPKIRVRSRKTVKTVADELIDRRNRLKIKQSNIKNDSQAENVINELEEQIAEALALEGRKKAYQFKKHCAQNGSVSVGDMWGLKKRLWPKNKETIPTGKLNHKGKLVTSPEDIKSLLHKEYNERLRARPEHPNMKSVFEAKKNSFKAKITKAKFTISTDWNMSQLEAVLLKIGYNKSRDPEGLNRSIFNTNCIGID